MALDSIREAERRQADVKLAILQSDTIQLEGLDSLGRAQLVQNTLRDKYGIFAVAAEGAEKTWTIENKLQKLTFSNKGGFLKQVELKDYKTYDSLPLISFDPETVKFDLSFFAQNRIVNTSQFYFQPYMNGRPYKGGDMTVAEGDSIVFALRLPTDDASKYIEYVYTIHDDNYMMDFDIRTVGLRDVIATNANYMTIHPDRLIEEWPDKIVKRERIGDWEGDTVCGAVGKGRIATFVDRKSRFLCASRLATKKPEDTRLAIKKALKGVPYNGPMG